MSEYLVAWEINVEADSPEAAAVEAERMRSEQAIATWTVTDETGEQSFVDVDTETGKEFLSDD